MAINIKAETPGIKLLYFIGLVLASLTIFYVGITVFVLTGYIDDPSNLPINTQKLIQLFSSIALFFIPSILFVKTATDNPASFLRLETRTRPVFYLLIPILMVSLIPIINLMAELNANIKFPESLKGLENLMQEYEKNAEVITKQFLDVHTIPALLFNIFLIAIIPAIGEELLFRGIVQKLFVQSTKNIHVGIWLSAIIFSALHFQFYGFLPRMMMGVLFGYLFVWTNSLWIPIFAHFLNNGTAVVGSYLVLNGYMDAEVEQLGANGDDIVFNFTSLVVVSLLLVFFYSNRVERD